MTSLTHQGLNYRTKPLAQAQAERFAQCISHNAAFTNVEVQPSKSAGKFVVLYQPSNAQRLAELLDGEQAKREERAATEGQGYLFVLDDSSRYFHCLSASGEVYETTERSCNCPDWTYRGSKAGVACKHQIALHTGAGEVRGW